MKYLYILKSRRIQEAATIIRAHLYIEEKVPFVTVLFPSFFFISMFAKYFTFQKEDGETANK